MQDTNQTLATIDINPEKHDEMASIILSFIYMPMKEINYSRRNLGSRNTRILVF